ncbi:hypothetical protein Mp_8g00990 [Marchantia polymorpha subsp. ruderalis]|uniref:Uncharacterized protein n=1 Tax=Marchantia polymorpha TaxID=3197 RepID=A0A2R6WRH5_MARPO|nr:hypothetical protein MARPO_0064s0099 [Marchantia polymorpha]BBN18249.1 hypothetical protein Mp_8g00990 [Marchantia polymorpha subsp. ruderalis]|eukprot:PTQ36424.1 hypothetical protein MARPO_0064s0099 [Marchantia polymorpha]
MARDVACKDLPIIVYLSAAAPPALNPSPVPASSPSCPGGLPRGTSVECGDSAAAVAQWGRTAEQNEQQLQLQKPSERGRAAGARPGEQASWEGRAREEGREGGREREGQRAGKGRHEIFTSLCNARSAKAWGSCFNVRGLGVTAAAVAAIYGACHDGRRWSGSSVEMCTFEMPGFG